MTRIVLVASLAAVVLSGSVPSSAVAQEAKTARGTVAALSGDRIAVNVRGQEMNFTVDTRTVVQAPGAGTKGRQAQAAGKPGPALGDVLKTGQAVEVSYRESGDGLHATRLRAIATARP